MADPPMIARLQFGLRRLADAFWVAPAALVIILAALGVAAVEVQKSGALPTGLPDSWIYGGGETGARTLLGAIASSTIGVAGTLFSITIAALTLASSQMGPRLLHNFMRDRGNQATLGILLGTFAYAVVVLRSVRGGEQDPFVPALGVSLGLVLAAGCVAALVYFIHHVAGRINVDTVIRLVHLDLNRAIDRQTAPRVKGSPPPLPFPEQRDTIPVRIADEGYLAEVDRAALAAWASKHDLRIRLIVRPGDFVFAGSTVGFVSPPRPIESAPVARMLTLSVRTPSTADLNFPVQQLVEVALRALSPNLNDPQTAINVLDRLGSALARLASRRFPSDVEVHAGEARALIPSMTYDALLHAMFDMIRHAAANSPSVLVHLLRTLAVVAEVERDDSRRDALRRTAEEVREQARSGTTHAHDLMRLEAAHRTVLKILASPIDDAL